MHDAVLEAIVDTFVEVSPAERQDRGRTMADLIGRFPSAVDRRALGRVLSLLDTPAGALLITGRPTRFQDQPQPRRIAVMQAWARSRLPIRRRLFTAFKRLTLLSHLSTLDQDGRNAAWPQLGYPGPISAPPPAAAALRTLDIEQDTTLTCDAVVVGSGAGGGVAAAQLAAAGKDVIVLEQGRQVNENEFTQRELEMLDRLYVGAGTAATDDLGVVLLAGQCLGGGTVVNYSTSFRTPDWLRRQWAERYGLDLFLSDEYGAALDAVCDRLSVNIDHNRLSGREQVLERGLEALGWHVEPMPRNVKGCSQDALCGFCGYGCQLGAKQSTVRTYLADAAAGGARIVTDCRVDRVVVENGRATGVEATIRARASSSREPVARDEHRIRLRVRSGVVAVAAGSLETPALLLRSSVSGPAIGRGLRLHPVSAMWGVFEESVRPWEGTMQAVYSDQLADLDGAHFGAKLETAPVHPGLLALGFPWRSPAAFATLARRYPHISVIGALLRDRDGGRVRVDDDGAARVHYRLSEYDRRHLREALLGAARVMLAAGASEVFTSQSAGVSFRAGDPAGLDALAAGMDRAGYDPGQITLASFHQMASCRMGLSPQHSVVGPDQQCHTVRGLFVMDASAFPDASGVNPMITIMAMAHRASRFATAAC
ncbi:MAG TPA: GMC family oxidoreductase [Candidatus Dormibacteraeota bacterium]